MSLAEPEVDILDGSKAQSNALNVPQSQSINDLVLHIKSLHKQKLQITFVKLHPVYVKFRSAGTFNTLKLKGESNAEQNP